ncbi:hypothetical protein [Apibacter sp. HY039]|uniref:hypothetical protein n=1 Tax=Apibacter sp. HY039 TaxID=2501476 RepID=UPI000FEB82E1|nr:hypothetical protein [Apibacter sp. HY039]
MRNCILFLLVFILSCKKTPEDYSGYPFIDQGIQSKKYEISTILPSKVELLTIFGHRYTEDPRALYVEEIKQMPLVVYDKSNTLYFRYTNNHMINDFKYNMTNHIIDTLSSEAMNVVRNSYTNKEDKFINFKFPVAEKYYTVLNEENHSEISEEKRNRILKEYKNSSEEIKQDIIKTFSIRYTTLYVELQMPEEKIQFKFNNDLNKNIEFFGNEELYKKGYIYVYIYNKLSMFPHSGGLYLVRPKEKK